MTAQPTNTDFVTSLLAITSDPAVNRIQDNVTQKNATLQMVKDKGDIMIDSSGNDLVVPLMVTDTDLVDSVTYYDELPSDPQAGFIDGVAPRAYYAAKFMLSKIELDKNSGSAKIADLLASRTMQAENSMNSRMNSDLWLDGTGNSSKDILGFKAMCPESASASNYMSVNGTNNSVWNSQYKTGATSTVIAELDKLFYALSDGSDAPDVVITNGLGLSVYENAMRAVGNPVVMNAKLADAGIFRSEYKQIGIILDQAAPSYNDAGTYAAYHMFNTEYMGLYFNQMGNYERVPKGTFDEYTLMVAIQVLTNNRRRQGRLDLTS